MDFTSTPKKFKYTYSNRHIKPQISHEEMLNYIKMMRYVNNNNVKSSISKILDSNTRQKCIKLYNELHKKIYHAKPMIVRTNLQFGGANHIGTPKPCQMTPDYLRNLSILIKKDMIYDKADSIADGYCGVDGLPNDILKNTYESMKTCELVNGSVVTQLQGNQSMLRQVGISGSYDFMARATILPASYDRSPNEFGVPQTLLNLFLNLKSFNDRCSLVIARHPLLLFYALISTLSIYVTDDECFRIHACYCKNANADFDGDALTMAIYHGSSVMYSIPLRLSPYFNMRAIFGFTRISFTQPMIVRMYHFENLLRDRDDWCGFVYRFVLDLETKKSHKKNQVTTIRDKLTKTLRFVAETMGSHKAYEWYMTVNDICYKNTIDTDRIFPIQNYSADDPVCAAIAKSGTASSMDVLQQVNSDFPIKNIIEKTIEYCINYTLSATKIAEQYTHGMRLQKLTEWTTIDQNWHVVFGFNHSEEATPLITLIDLIEPMMYMSEHTVEYLLND